MKKILFVVVFTAASLLPAACGKLPQKPCDFDGNPAIAHVCAVAPGSRCQTVVRDTGDKHVYTAQCTMSNKDVFNILWSLDKPFEIDSRLVVAGEETQKKQREAEAKAKEQELIEARKKLEQQSTTAPVAPDAGSGSGSGR